jgi:hypothetical protein
MMRHGRACPGHPRLWPAQHFRHLRKVVDARHKAGHDGEMVVTLFLGFAKRGVD